MNVNRCVHKHIIKEDEKNDGRERKRRRMDR